MTETNGGSELKDLKKEVLEGISPTYDVTRQSNSIDIPRGPPRPILRNPKRTLIDLKPTFFTSRSEEDDFDLFSGPVKQNQNKSLVDMAKLKSKPIDMQESTHCIHIEKDDSGHFDALGKGTVNSAIILLLLLLVRLSPELVNGEKINRLLGPNLREYTGWKELNYYISLPYWPGYSLAALFCCIVGLTNIFVILPSILSSRDKMTQDDFKGKVIYFISHHISNPYTLFIFYISCMGLAHLGTILGLYFKIIPIVITSRAIFGILDGIHTYYHSYFLVKRFRKEKFVLAIGFLFSIESFCFTVDRFIPPLQDPFTFLWVSLGFYFISIFASITIPYVDMDKGSVFNAKIEDNNKKEEPDDSPQQVIMRVFYFFSFLVIDQLLNICTYVGLFIFPFHFGGAYWHLNTNHQELVGGLTELKSIVYFTRGIVSPGIGALLDVEKFEIEHNGTFKDSFIEILSKSKIRFYSLFIGILSVMICNLCLYNGWISERSPGFYLFAVFNGIAFSLLMNCLFTLPMLYFTNAQKNFRTLSYITYQSLSGMIWSVSRVINIYVITNETIMLAFWYPSMIIMGLFLVLMTFIFFFYIFFLRKSDVKIKVTDENNKTIEAVKKKKLQNWEQYYQLIYLVPFEALSLIFYIILALFGCGIANIVLIYTFSSKKDIADWFILPVLSIVCIISMRLAFPEVLSKFFGSVFFRQTRKILGYTRKSTIAQRLQTNPNFSIATEVLEKSKFWKALNQPKLNIPLVAFVVPDEIVLQNEEERVKVLGMMDDENYEQLDVRKCSNGIIVVDSKTLEKNIFVYEKSPESVKTKYKGKFLDFKFFTEKFLFYVFGGYVLFFTIPIFFKAFQKILCTSCQVSFFIDNIVMLTNAITFCFGFFILIPTIGLWNEISNILERINDMIFVFKSETMKTFAFNNPDAFDRITLQNVQNWDKQMAHLQAMTMSKGSFLRYIFMLSIGTSKLFSIAFSLAALFLKFTFNAEMIQLTFLVVLMEIAVMRYVIQPSSSTTTEFKLTILQMLLREKMYNKYIETANLDEEKKQKMMKISRYMRIVLTHWDSQCTLNETGFSVKSTSIQTRWYINSELMRTNIQTFMLTVVPSLVTYFVRQIFGI